MLLILGSLELNSAKKSSQKFLVCIIGFSSFNNHVFAKTKYASLINDAKANKNTAKDILPTESKKSIKVNLQKGKLSTIEKHYLQ
jgi:hypothetical protein